MNQNVRRNYHLYIHVNKVNKKRYVGITCQDIKKRWGGGSNYKNSTYFYHAIQKYGWNNFDHYVLYTELTKEEAEQKEIELIAFWNTTDHNNGYNLAKGGESRNGIKLTRKQIEKMRERMLGTKHSKETIEKMKKVHKGKHVGELNNMYGKHWNENQRKIITEANRKNQQGGNNSNARRVKCITTGEIFDCISDAMRKYDINKTNISACCKGKRKTAGKMTWEYV